MRLSERVATQLGAPVSSTAPVAGGDICAAWRVDLADGRTVFAKTRPDAPAGFFAIEAAGLEWLRAAAGAPVPEVLGVADDLLVLAWVAGGEPTVRAAERFGAALAATHAAGAPTFGAPRDGFIGSLQLPNAPAPDWPTFYARQRVLPYLRAAVDAGAVDSRDASSIERLLDRLPGLAGEPEPPARVHGDLWSGNVRWAADGQGWLLDPAAHGGHRETDLAMLALFGAPQLERVLAAYDEAWPLREGWRRRVPLHQLHPLLVHAVLFGAGYGRQAGAAARRALAA